MTPASPDASPDLPPRAEETLDPANWDELRALGHRMLDDMLDWLSTRREHSAWRPLPASMKAALDQPLPTSPESAAKVYDDFRAHVFPYAMPTTHPRFWGWVIGSGTPLGMLADMLVAGINANAGGAEQAAPYVERQVLAWCKAMLGFPAEASGLLVTGGSVANLVALTVARDATMPNVLDEGLAASGARFAVYASEQVHNSVDKAMSVLGLGRRSLRKIPTDEAYRIDLEALEARMASDRAEGWRPLAIIGCAGTVNTAAFDDLDALATIAKREGVWYHVDGAFGALAHLSDALRPMVQGMERADSLAFDLHKWLHMPFDMGCVLVRDREAHKRSFSLPASYLTMFDRGIQAGDEHFFDYGLELSRRFRALPAWMSIKEQGVGAFARQVEQNVRQARYLASLVEDAPDLELLAPVPLNIVCFRFVREAASEDELNALNREILMQIHERGIAVPTSTVLRGKFAIRTSITNHRSRREDFDLLVTAVREIGAGL